MLQLPNGTWTNNLDETYAHLLEVHFPGCTRISGDILQQVPNRAVHGRRHGGEQGGQAPTLEKIRVGMANPGNFSRGLKTFWQ